MARTNIFTGGKANKNIFQTPQKKTSNKQSLTKTNANYKKRLAAAGVDSKSVTDKRNFIEKALKLEEGQNVLFDVLEILGRPQNAIFTGIDKAINKGSFAEGFKEGLSGETKTSGKELLRNTNLAKKDRAGKIDAIDVLGLGLDIVADPVDLALIPVTAGGSIVAKGVGTAAKGLGTAKDISKATNVLGDVAKGVKFTNKAADASKANKALNLVKDTSQFTTKTRKFISPTEGVIKLTGKAVKKTAKGADNLLEAVLKGADARRGTDALGAYKDLKKGITRTFDSSKNALGLVGKGRDAANTSKFNVKAGEYISQELKNDIDNIANKVGKSSKEINKMLTYAIESEADWTLRGQDVLKRFKKAKSADFYTEEAANAVSKALDDFGIRTQVDDTSVVLLSPNADKQKLYNLSEALDSNSQMFGTSTLGSKISKEVDAAQKEARDFFRQDPELEKLFQKAKVSHLNIAKTQDRLTGVNSAARTTENHVRHAKDTDDAPSTLNAFRSRDYDTSVMQANEAYKKSLRKASKQSQEALERVEKGIYKTNDEGEFLNSKGKVTSNTERVIDNTYQKELVQSKERKIANFNKTLASKEELSKFKNNLDIDESKLLKKDAKTIAISKGVKELESDIAELKRLPLNDINTVNTEAVDNLSGVWRDYYTKRTAYIKKLSSSKATSEEIKAAREASNLAKTKLTAQINVVKQLTNKQARQVVKEANKGFQQGKKIGAQIAKAEAQLKKQKALINEAYKAADDLVQTLPGKISYEIAALDKLKGASESILKKQIAKAEDLAKTSNILAESEGKNLFKTMFTDTLDSYVIANARQSKGAQIMNEALIAGVFRNPDFVKKADDLVDGKIPYNFEKVSGSYLMKRINTFKEILPESSKTLVNTIDDFSGQVLYMDKQLMNTLDLAEKATKDIHPLLRVIDGVNTTFKKYKTLTFGTQMRNIIGNTTNMALSGMPAQKIPAYWGKSISLLNRTDELVKKFTTNTLTEADMDDWKILEQFYKAGFDDAFKGVQNLEDVAQKAQEGKGLLKGLTNASMKANQYVDGVNRLSLLMYAMDNPQYVQKLGKSDAIDAVRYALFDPDNMSDFERNFMKRAMPFYTFTKQNLMFQAENIIRNTPKYKKLYKGIRDIYADLPEDSYYDYQRDAMQIPVPFFNENGQQLFLKTNLPISDLGEYISNPMQRIVSATNPLIKTPFEMVTGVNTFTGQSNNFKTASSVANTLGIDLPEGVNSIADTAEHIINGLGVNTITTDLVRKVSSIIDGSQGEKTGNEMWAEILKSVFQNTDQEKVENSRLYEEMQAYQEYIKSLKNQGIDVPTIREINAANKNKLNRLKNKRASLR